MGVYDTTADIIVPSYSLMVKNSFEFLFEWLGSTQQFNAVQ